MSANESELPAVREEGEMIDSIYEDFQAIFEGLPCEETSPVERYDEFDNATQLINWVQSNLEVGEEDIDRVLEAYENHHCPYCEEEDVDSTIEFDTWETRQDSFREDADERVSDVRLGYCMEHEEAYLEFELTYFE